MVKIKTFFSKIKTWLINHKPTRRRIIQLYVALLTNANLKGFVTGKIYRGATKNLCVPGLNCYSCPGAVGACPMGALQNAMAVSSTKTPYYILGILALFGLALGRTICGFLCPIGLGQELLYKIKSPKLKKSKITRVLSYFKYVILTLAIAIPIIYAGVPFFCKYICPAGTFEGAVGLLANPKNNDFFGMLGYLFTWKFVLLIVFIVASIFIYRFFCRFFCPLGAIYSLFSKIALIGVKLDDEACVDCGKCIAKCKMDIKKVGDQECIHCGECISECPTQAISWKGSKIFLPKSALGTETSVLINKDNSEIVSKKEKFKSKLPKIIKIVSCSLASVLLIFALVYYNFILKDEKITVYATGDKCQEFTLELFDTANSQEKFSILESRGKIVVINFWQITCDPCVAELPHFEKIYNEFSDKLVMVAINDDEERYETVENFIAKEDINRNKVDWTNYNMMFAKKDFENDVYKMLGGKGAYPLTVILDEDGVIASVNQGALSEIELRAIIVNLLTE